MQFDLNHGSSLKLRLRVRTKCFRFRFSKSKPQRKIIIHILEYQVDTGGFCNNNPAIYCVQFWAAKMSDLSVSDPGNTHREPLAIF